MDANTKIALGEVAVPLAPVDAERLAGGAPLDGFAELDADMGVWEMTPGVATDVEEDEYFVVLSGSAMLTFSETGERMSLAAGDFVRLAEGTPTVWDVTQTLRKMYITPAQCGHKGEQS